MKNYNWKEDDIDIGFKQGVLFCCTLASKSNPPTIPRRFQVALEELRNNQDIVVTKADKGGGIVIMDKTEYIRKMEALLSDTNTYRPQTEQQAKDEANIFNKEARKLLRRTEKGKRLLHLLEENPRIPSMRGLPKTHKPEIPLRPITSGIGSAPHRYTKKLLALIRVHPAASLIWCDQGAIASRRFCICVFFCATGEGGVFLVPYKEDPLTS
ncbi:uncharacterized protein LOC143037831 [Oratosquilla oratoria]|uniref:uncharacterized protein LOC143037831 n=1 Tax=Oratosquilla oratoria TaxID=337810 RepID=UPI003F7658C3